MTTFGIDLGTTNSCIAYVDSSLRPVVLKSAQGKETTPSVVYFESARHVVVGEQARNSAVLEPDLVREMVKRDIGLGVRYTYHDRPFTPASVSALILRELARAAHEETGDEVSDVVITVPAYFGVLEREVTRKAGEMAGLNVLDVLEEPVAAALAYQALEEGDGVRHIFVYDLGGGTFDTAVIRLEGTDVRVICIDGNNRLGGADWDQKIRDFLLRTFTDRYPQLDPGGDEHFMQDLTVAAEDLKKGLSANLKRTWNMRFDGCAVQAVLTREQLEDMTSELLEQTMEITGRTIATAKEKGVERFNDVLLVGGMTISPVIARTLKERFGLDARHKDPHLAVVQGAARYAVISKIQVSLPDETPQPGDQDTQAVASELGIAPEAVGTFSRIRVATVVPRAFGLKVVDDTDPVFAIDPGKARQFIEHLLTANTPLPADTGWQKFSTVKDSQRTVELEVWEQAGAIVSRELQHNTDIGRGTLRDLPPRPAGATFEVVFRMTDIGRLHVHGREPSSGSEVRFEVKIGPPGGDDDDPGLEDIEVSG